MRHEAGIRLAPHAMGGRDDAPSSVADSFEPFRPRRPWWGGHLQTVRNLVRPRPIVGAATSERVLLPLDDGTGDRLPGTLYRPRAPRSDAPLLIVVHGLGGDETSPYVLSTAAHFLAKGWPVLALNLRNAAPARATARGWCHAGKAADLRAAVAAAADLAPARGIALLGYSLGGNLLLKYLAEPGVHPAVRAAATVSAPLDLNAASDLLHERRNRLYQAYLLRGVKSDYLYAGTTLPPDLREAARRARTLFDLDDAVTAPLHGFRGVRHYYEEASCLPGLAGIRVPTLLIHAADDPFVPAAPYAALGANPPPSVTPLVAPGGGHVGFHDPKGLWHLRQIEAFLNAAVLAPDPTGPRHQPRTG